MLYLRISNPTKNITAKLLNACMHIQIKKDSDRLCGLENKEWLDLNYRQKLSVT